MDLQSIHPLSASNIINRNLYIPWAYWLKTLRLAESTATL